MYIILRKKYIFNINIVSEDSKWLYLTGNCKELLYGERIICLEKTNKNYKRIIY